MNSTELMTLIKDVILSCAAIVGAGVAIKGLSTWKRQLKGQSEYELSRRILITLFKYRDAIAGVRHPLMFAYEMPSPPEDTSIRMSPERIRFYGISKAYQARWNKVQTERTSLYADLLESEAIWDDKLKKLFKVLFDLEYELFISTRDHIDSINPDTNETTKESIGINRTQRRDIMYDDLSEDGDSYRQNFQLGVEEIEKYLKPKLHDSHNKSSH